MKQRITPEQLGELTEGQKQRLRDWWKPEEGDCLLQGDKQRHIYDKGCMGNRLIFTDVNWIYECNVDGEKADCLPLLSIGQMFELITGKHNIILSKFDVWPDWILSHGNVAELHHSTNIELCDALWEAVKAVL